PAVRRPPPFRGRGLLRVLAVEFEVAAQRLVRLQLLGAVGLGPYLRPRHRFLGGVRAITNGRTEDLDRRVSGPTISAEPLTQFAYAVLLRRVVGVVADCAPNQRTDDQEGHGENGDPCHVARGWGLLRRRRRWFALHAQ